MFIAVEGTDASGKSSLCAEIARQLEERGPVRTIHQGRPQEESRLWVLNEYGASIENTDFLNEYWVADRWHWGEATYAPLKRPHTCVNDNYGLLGIPGWRWVEMVLASRGVSQFWLYQPLDVIQMRLRGRGDDYVTEQDLETIIGLYTTAAKSTHGLAGTITPPPDSIDEIPNLAAALIEIATKRVYDAEFLREFPEYIGAVKPKALLVGDDRINKDGTILPFMPYNGNSGDYLLSALPETLWREVGVVNSDDVKNMRFIELWMALGQPQIVALGRMAEKRLLRSGVSSADIIVAPHPQYVRRFHHHDRVEYGLALERFANKETTEGDPWILP